MTKTRSAIFAAAFCVLTTTLTAAWGLDQAPATVESAKTWLDKAAQIEEYLKSAEVTGIEEIGVGVTKPGRGRLAPGGLVESIAWKPIKPGRYSGFVESYKSEIAAYELDKLLGLGMVPPTVEKQIKGQTGAAVMWVSPAKSFKELGGVPGQAGIKGPPPAQIAPWSRQLTKAKMFDNLIANIDPNLGNWLVDPAWNIILIDHTRSFTNTKELYHKMSQNDAELWAKMKALDEPTLTTALGAWISKDAIKAMLQRRDKMQEVIDKLPGGTQN